MPLLRFGALPAPAMPADTMPSTLDPRLWAISDALVRNPRSLVRGGRVLRPERVEAPRPASWLAPPMPEPEPDPAPLPAPTGMTPPMAPDAPRSNVGTGVSLNDLDPRTAAIGDLLTRSGQMREQGREAGAQAGAGRAFGSGAAGGANLGFGDELSGLASASGLPSWVPGMIPPAVGAVRVGLDAAGLTGGGATQAYEDQRDRARGYQEGARDAQPVAEIGGQLAGGFALPFGAVRGASLGANVGRGMAAGAAIGAASGFGGGEGLQDRAMQAGAYGTIGGTLGGVAPALPGLLGRAVPARRAAMPSTAAPAIERTTSAADDAIEAIRAGAARHFDDPSFGLPRQAPGPEVDAAIEAIRAGLARNAEPAPFGFGPYGTGPGGAVDDGMEAIRAGIQRNLGDPTLGQRAAGTASPRPVTFGDLPPGPYGKAPSASIENGMSALRSALLGTRGVAPVAFGALGAGGLGASAAMASPRPSETDATFAERFDQAPPGKGFDVEPRSVAALRSGLLRQAPGGVVPLPGEAPEADVPVTGAVPIAGRAPGDLPAPAPRPLSFGALPASSPQPVAPVPAAQSAPPAEAADDGGGFLSRLGDPRVANLLLGVGQGLLSTKGFGPGLAAGSGFVSRLNREQAATDLASAELGLKTRKLAQEAAGQNSTVDLLTRAGHSPEAARAMVLAAGAGNREALSNALNNLLPKQEPPSGYTLDPSGRAQFIPGGPQDPATISAQTAARQTDEPQLVDVPQADGSTRKMWVRKGEGDGAAVGAPKLPASETREFTGSDGVKRPYVRDPATGSWRALDVGGDAAAGNPFATGRFNNDQGKAAGFSDRMMGSESILRGVEGINSGFGGGVEGAMASWTPNFMKSDDRQKFEQAKRDFTNAQLRRESGAAIAKSEFTNADQQYFPQPGDSASTIAQKRANRRSAIEAMAREGGPAYLPKSVFDQSGALVPYQRGGAAPGRSALEAEARRRGLIR